MYLIFSQLYILMCLYIHNLNIINIHMLGSVSQNLILTNRTTESKSLRGSRSLTLPGQPSGFSSASALLSFPTHLCLTHLPPNIPHCVHWLCSLRHSKALPAVPIWVSLMTEQNPGTKATRRSLSSSKVGQVDVEEGYSVFSSLQHFGFYYNLNLINTKNFRKQENRYNNDIAFCALPQFFKGLRWLAFHKD